MLRNLSEKDLPYLLAIEQATQFTPWTEEIFMRCLQVGCRGWVVELDQTVVGFILLSALGEEGHVLNLCIHPDQQRCGYGKQLLLHALEESEHKGVKLVLLEVRSSNLPAIHLYEQTGFIQIGERKNYYPAPTGRENALVFAKDLGVE